MLKKNWIINGRKIKEWLGDGAFSLETVRKDPKRNVRKVGKEKGSDSGAEAVMAENG